MEFKDAFVKLIDNHGFDILHERFRTRSILSDYVGADFYSKKLIDIFLSINCSYNLRFILMDKGLTNARAFFTSIYPNFKDLCTKAEFVDAINPISKIVCPDEYNFYESNKEKKDVKVSGVAQIVRNKKTMKINNPKIQKITPTPQPNKQANKQKNNQANNQPNNQANNQQNINKNYQNIYNLIFQRYFNNPPQKKTPVRNKVKGINISVMASLLNITSGSNKDVELYIDSNKTPMSLKQFPNKNEIYDLSLMYPGKIIEIRLTKNVYKDIKIDSNNTNIIISPKKGKMKINNLNITSKNGYVVVNARTKLIKVKAFNGNIQLHGDCEEVDLNTNNGNICFGVYPVKEKTLKITCKADNGSIKCLFHDYKMPYYIRTAIHNKKIVKKKFKINNIPVILNAITTNGIIELG